MVLLTPTMRDRSTPSEATVAPTRTTGAKEAQAPAVTASPRNDADAPRHMNIGGLDSMRQLRIQLSSPSSSGTSPVPVVLRSFVASESS